jgi:hypothetical protein
MTRALLAEVTSDRDLVRAIRRMRRIGYTRIDAIAPHEVHELDVALREPRSTVPLWAFIGGIVGLTSAYGCQWSITEYAWPLNVGGRPLHSAPAFIPIAYELTILGAALATLIALIFKARLGSLYKPIDEIDDVRSSTLDGYWLVISAADPRFDWQRTRADLARFDPRKVIAMGEPS